MILLSAKLVTTNPCVFQLLNFVANSVCCRLLPSPLCPCGSCLLHSFTIILVGFQEGVEITCVSTGHSLEREGTGPGHQTADCGNQWWLGRSESTPRSPGLADLHGPVRTRSRRSKVGTANVPLKQLDHTSPRHSCRDSLFIPNACVGSSFM